MDGGPFVLGGVFREPTGVPSTVDFLPSVLFALLILLASGWLMQTHVRTWQAVRRRAGELEARELDYRRRQFRRRMQTSALLGAVGICVLVGKLLLVLRAPPLVVLFFWCGVMMLAVWLGLLAVSDMVCTQAYFRRLKQNYVIEEARLKAELQRIKRTHGNGRADEQVEGKGGEEPPTGPDG
jgi:hypothetical protein